MWADIFTDFERRETLGRAMMMRRRRAPRRADDAAAQKAKSPNFVQKQMLKWPAIHRVKWENLQLKP